MKIFKVRIRRQENTAIEPKGGISKDISRAKYDKMFAIAVDKDYWVLDNDLYDYQGKGGTRYTNMGNIESGKVGFSRYDVFIRVKEMKRGKR